MRLFGGRPDWLIVGLGNPGRKYASTRHNVGFAVTSDLAELWDLPKPKERFRGLISEGRAGVGGPRVAILQPQTYVNDSGKSVGPARGALQVPLDRLVVVHDEIDRHFGDVRTRLGGGTGGHNGIKSLDRELGARDFWRVHVGVGRPDTGDPEIVSAHVLGKFTEPSEEVEDLLRRARDVTERLVLDGGVD